MTIYGNASTKDITNYRLLVTHDQFPVTLTLPPLKGMGFFRNFALNIPERQLLVLWGKSPHVVCLFGAAYYLTSVLTF